MNGWVSGRVSGWRKGGTHLPIDGQGGLNQLLEQQGEPRLLQGVAEPLPCRCMHAQGHLKSIQSCGQRFQKPAHGTTEIGSAITTPSSSAHRSAAHPAGHWHQYKGQENGQSKVTSKPHASGTLVVPAFVHANIWICFHAWFVLG